MPPTHIPQATRSYPIDDFATEAFAGIKRLQRDLKAKRERIDELEAQVEELSSDLDEVRARNLELEREADECEARWAARGQG